MAGTDEAAATEFVWTVHPVREHWRRATLAVVAILAIAGLSATLMQSPWWALLTVLLMVFMLNRFFLPSRFHIDADGLTAKYPLRTQRFAWTDARRFDRGSYGGVLSTRATRSRFDGSRSVHLLFGADRDEAVRRIIDHLPEGVA